MRWVAGEAGRNLLSGTTHALRWAIALALVLGTLVLAEAATVDALLRRAAAYRDSGGSVLTLEAVGRVDGARCEAMATLPGVRAAGAVRAEQEPLVAALLPRGSIAAYRVTEGTLDLVHADRVASAGVVVSRQVADGLGLSPGSPLTTRSGATTVQGVYDWPDDGRRSGFEYAALIPAPAEEVYDQCWVAAWPVPTDLATVVRTVVLPADEQAAQVTVSRLNTTWGTAFDGPQLYRARVTRFAGAAAMVAGAVLGLVSVRSRRLELASARHVGASAVAQQLQILLESLVWVLAAAVLTAGVATAVAIGPGDADLRAGAIHVVLPALAATLFGAQLGVVSTRERHLFRYFKAR